MTYDIAEYPDLQSFYIVAVGVKAWDSALYGDSKLWGCQKPHVT